MLHIHPLQTKCVIRPWKILWMPQILLLHNIWPKSKVILANICYHKSWLIQTSHLSVNMEMIQESSLIHINLFAELWFFIARTYMVQCILYCNKMQGDDSSEGSKIRRRQGTPGSGKEAAAVRKLPESATRSPPPQPEQKEKPKKVGAT